MRRPSTTSSVALFVIRLNPRTRAPAWRATIVSWAVLMPTASPPKPRSIRISARVSNEGPASMMYTLAKRDAGPFRGLASGSPEPGIVGVGHGRESLAESVEVRAAERVVARQVDVVGDEHHVAGNERRARPPAAFVSMTVRTQREDRAQEQRRLAVGVALVWVCPAERAGPSACRRRGPRQMAGVTCDQRSGDVRDVGVPDRHALRRVEDIGDPAEARSEHDHQLRAGEPGVIREARG